MNGDFIDCIHASKAALIGHDNLNKMFTFN